MQDSHLRGWVILFVCLLCLGGIGYLVHIVRQLHRDHRNAAGGISVGDIAVVKETIEQSSEEIRKHISSNHDEIDGEVRRIAANTEKTQNDLEYDRRNKFAEDLARELQAAKAVQEELKRERSQ